MRLRDRRAFEKPEVMIIPMIDIMFFLLVFFIMSTLYMVNLKTVDVNLPKAQTAQTQLNLTSIVTVSNDGIFTRYVSSLTQRADVVRLFPAGFTPTDNVQPDIAEARFEPSPKQIIDDIAYRLISARLFQALMDSRASEHSMRMLAMKNATDNATDLVDALTLEMNKARQAAITQELTEISAGVEAMR